MAAAPAPPPAPPTSPAPAVPPVPAGFRLRPDPGLRTLDGGTLLVGGSPSRLLRLTSAGAGEVAGWWAGRAIPDKAAPRALARRLLDAGMAHPALGDAPAPGDAGVPAAPGPGDVTVVIPVLDRPAELARCLAGLSQSAAAAARRGRGRPRVIVVDDGSADPGAIARVAASAGARLVRRPVNGGPGAGRNTGLAAAGTPLVAFLDSDCVPAPGWLDRLLPHFADPAVGAVAPRIVPHERGRTWLARYEGASSTLDMGARANIVRPGSRVPYVPGAALVVRRPAAGTGFAEDMPVGEDVDFAWRMAAAGWRIRYEPEAVMGHQHRVRLRTWFARRKDYGTSAAALELRHPGAVRPLYISRWTALAWLAAVSGRPAAAAAVTAAATALLARRLSRVTRERWPIPATLASSASVASPASRHRPAGGQRRRAVAWRLAARLAGGGTVAAGRPLGSALSRAWWPVAVPAAVAVPRLRLPVAALILAPPLLDWADRRPPLDPARYVAARLLDDIAYSLGVWQGCLSRRTARPLLPVAGTGRALPRDQQKLSSYSGDAGNFLTIAARLSYRREAKGHGFPARRARYVMRQGELAAPVVAGVCAAALTVSLQACAAGAAPVKAVQTRSMETTGAPVTASPARATPVRATRAHHAFHRIKIPGRVLDDPTAIAAEGNRVWVASSLAVQGGNGGWVTELDGKTGALIRVISAKRDKLTDPEAIAAAGNRIWVVNSSGNSVTEIDAATGALIRVISARRYQLNAPEAIAVDGNGVWVANEGSNSVTEIDAATGALIRVISARRYQLNNGGLSVAIAAAGNNVWVPNINGNSVTEIDAATGALIRVISGQRYELNNPAAIAVNGNQVWVVNGNPNSVTEFDAATGALIRVMSSVPNVPYAIAPDGAGVWLVTNLGTKAVDGTTPDGSVAELSATTGLLIRNTSGPPFRAGNPGGYVAAAGSDVWVTNTPIFSNRGWVAEISATTGALIRVITG